MHASKIAEHTRLVKEEAKRLGFLKCGVAKAGFLEEEAPLLDKWLFMNMHGAMAYMENHYDKRLDPGKLVPGAKSVVSLSYNYYPAKDVFRNKKLKISKYAYGRDYHDVIKDKLRELMAYIHDHIGEVNGRVFVDSAPVMERAWAKKSGVGWQGKHSLSISRDHGSFFFLAELIIDLELLPDPPAKDYCGSCTRCIEACPTNAIAAPGLLDASRCISYLTIELKDNIPSEFQGKYENWIFGCDICQDVCPWNRFAKPHNEPQFEPSPDLDKMSENDWLEITEDVFRDLFRKSAVKRTKFQGLKRNIAFVSGAPEGGEPA